jgi:hypothetical protein
MDDKLRSQIRNELNLRDSEDLVRIWREPDLREFYAGTFEIVRDILQARLGGVECSANPASEMG